MEMDYLIQEAAVGNITKARSSLLSSNVFMGYLAMQLEPHPLPSIPSGATDGRYLFYNPQWWAEASLDDAKVLLEHELLHLALNHHTRRDTREFQLWQSACDYAVHNLQVEAGRRLPPNVLYSSQFNGKAAEEIYTILSNQPQDPGDGPQGSGEGNKEQEQGGPGNSQEPPNGKEGGHLSQAVAQGLVFDAAPGEKEAQQAKWEQAVIQAAEASTRAGQSSALGQRLVEHLTHHPLPWQDLLRQHMTALARDDFSWQRPNRRFIDEGMYLPSAQSEQLGTCVIAVDVSGSIRQDELNQFMAAVNDIFQEVSYESVHLLSINTKITYQEVFYDGEAVVPEELQGGGGTRFSPAFEYVSEQGLMPDVLIYFTDLLPVDGNRLEDPGYPVLWLDWKQDPEGWKPSFGEVIPMAT